MCYANRAVSASPELTLQVETENIVAVVDTNVLLDVFSCHEVRTNKRATALQWRC